MLWWRYGFDNPILVCTTGHAYNVLETEAAAINMSCNSKKTVCMVFSPINRRNIIGNSFPNFKLDGSNLSYVAKFKYLGHIIDNKLCDDLDIEREIK